MAVRLRFPHAQHVAPTAVPTAQPAWRAVALAALPATLALASAAAGAQQRPATSHDPHAHHAEPAQPAADSAAGRKAPAPRRAPAPAGVPGSAFGGWKARQGSAAPGAAARQVEAGGLRVEFALGTAAGRAPAAVAGQDATIRLRLVDAKTGAPAAGVELAGWIDRRRELGATPPDACKARVDEFVQSNLSMEGAIRARAVEDLNSYFVITLNESPDIAVLDPFLGFGRTKLYTTVPLRSPGVDWVLSPDGRRLFVSMPAVGEVAVVDVGSWKVAANVAVGGAPRRLALAPGGAQLWVVNDRDGGAAAQDSVAVIDARTLRVLARVPVGGGEHALAFDDEGRWAFVTNEASGTVTLVDAVRLRATAQVAVGARPTSVVYAAAAGAAYVLTQGTGALVAVDAARQGVVARVPVAPGARAVRVAPAMAKGHGSHGGGGHGPAAPSGRFAFVLDPGARSVHVVDATRHRVLRSMRFDHTPDQVGFTSSFAYVRFADSPKISMVSLDDPQTGGFGSMDVFEAGQQAPGDASRELASAVVSAPDMPDALYALNGAEKMVYYYHYMEGMPIPSGGLTTYTFQPRAVLVAGKALRETAPGEYAATVRVEEPGEYELALLVPSPRVVHCFPLTVRADSGATPARPALAVEPRPRRALRTGGDTLRFALVDRATGRQHRGLVDVSLLVASTSGWRRRLVASAAADGTYEAPLSLPAPGAYYVSVAVPSLRVAFNDRRPASIRAAAAGVASGSR